MSNAKHVEMMKLEDNAEEVMDWLGDALVGWDLDSWGPVYFEDGYVAVSGDWIVKGLDGKFRVGRNHNFEHAIGAA